MRPLFLCFVFFVFNSTTFVNKFEIKNYQSKKKRKLFLKQYVITDWDKFLWDDCEKWNQWNPEEAFMCFKAVAYQESRFCDNAIEWKWNRIISRGRFQIGKATYILFRDPKHKNLGFGNYYKDSHNRYINTEIFLWTMRLYWRIKPDYKYILSCHNVGLTGFQQWQKRRKKEYYYYYVNRVANHLPANYKYLLNGPH